MTQPQYVAAPAPVVVTQTTTSGGSAMRDAIPAFIAPVAIILAVLNFFFPGLGEFDSTDLSIWFEQQFFFQVPYWLDSLFFAVVTWDNPVGADLEHSA